MLEHVQLLVEFGELLALARDLAHRMPLAFSVMFIFFPAGLVLYWITNNVLSIAQQWFINKRLGVLGK